MGDPGLTQPMRPARRLWALDLITSVPSSSSAKWDQPSVYCT